MNFDEGAVDIGNFEPTDYACVNNHSTAADNGKVEMRVVKRFIFIRMYLYFLFLQNYY